MNIIQILMIVDIFSSFDPFINSFFYLFPISFWLLRLLRIILLSSSYWMGFNSFMWLISSPLIIMNEQSNRTFLHHIKGFRGVLVCIFVILITVNFIGLLPYVFSFSSHIVFSLILGLPFWLALVASSLINSIRDFIGGLLPGGAPNWLNPFLVIVETIRIIVRPLTLSVRLVANISAGHIVLSLIGIYCSSFLFRSEIGFIRLLIIQIFYIIFEVGICMIQGYIFCLLITLYADDHTHT